MQTTASRKHQHSCRLGHLELARFSSEIARIQCVGVEERQRASVSEMWDARKKKQRQA